jgi:ornithine carbamoyltransferase
MAPRHFLDISAFERADLRAFLDSARALKASGRRPAANGPAGKILAMIFDKPSTRTRVSFDVAMRQLGGETIVLNRSEMQLGRGETISDTARVLSRYVDIIMLRTGPHSNLTELAASAAVPVINGLTDASHPCQVMADVMTFEEHCGPIAGRVIAWIGDGNNVAASWMHAAARLGFTLRIACPEELAPDPKMLDWVQREGGDVRITRDPVEAVRDADGVVTDVWVSMGDGDAERRKALLGPYRVDQALMSRARPDAVFLHCLPAHRGDEVTAEVIDGPQSIVFDEAENRLHAQKAILAWCLENG